MANLHSLQDLFLSLGEFIILHYLFWNLRIRKFLQDVFLNAKLIVGSVQYLGRKEPLSHADEARRRAELRRIEALIQTRKTSENSFVSKILLLFFFNYFSVSFWITNQEGCRQQKSSFGSKLMRSIQAWAILSKTQRTWSIRVMIKMNLNLDLL